MNDRFTQRKATWMGLLLSGLCLLLVGHVTTAWAESSQTEDQAKQDVSLGTQENQAGQETLIAADAVETVLSQQDVVVGEDGEVVGQANPQGMVDVARSVTLRDEVVATLSRLAGVPAEQLRVKFLNGQDRILGRLLQADRYEIEPMSRSGLGRVPMVIRRYSGEELVQTMRCTADVWRRYDAVVAKKQIGRGQVILEEDVELRQVYLQAACEVIGDVNLVVGRVSRGMVREGAVIQGRQLQTAVVVKRGQMMPVRCVMSGLVVSTVARAMEDGGVGDVIKVRNEKSRQMFWVRVTGDGQGMLVEQTTPGMEETARAGEGGQG